MRIREIVKGSVVYVLVGVIDLYRIFVSPVLPRSCRFYPSCSEYAACAIKKHGLSRGIFLSIKRLLRCHPFCEGGIDPVP